MPKKSALEITSYPVAKVYLNDKEAGTTPYKNSGLEPSNVEIKLVTGDNKWSRKVKLQNNVNTVIDLEFGGENQEVGGYILYLEKTGDNKKAGIIVNSNPDKSTITIDNEVKGLTPNRISDIGEGDKHLLLSSPGYKNVDIFMKAINGYQLVVDVDLSKETNKLENSVNDLSGDDLELSSQPEQKIKVKATETGWLRVRETASVNGKEIVKIKTNEEYILLEEQTDWWKIDLGDSKSGWVSSKYVEKI